MPTTPSTELITLKRRLADGLSGWLTFEFQCGRGYLFSEYYLASAVGQLIRSRWPVVKAEIPHPTLASPGSIGRPPSIDFVAYDKDTPVLAVETKWTGYSAITASTLIWDAFRLHAFRRHTGAPGLLVLAGIQKQLETFFTASTFLRVKFGQPTTAPLLPLPQRPAGLKLLRNELPQAVAKYVDMKAAACPANAIADEILVGTPQVAIVPGHKSINVAVYVWDVHAREIVAQTDVAADNG